MLAGFGAVAIYRALPWRAVRIAAVLLIAFFTLNLAKQMQRSSFYYHADERNPCVYSHTSTDAVRAAQQIRAVALLAPDGKDSAIKVISPEYWPLPWYLRDFSRVGYWYELPTDPIAPIIIASPDMAEALTEQLGDEYFSTLAGLRPGFFLQIFIRQDLWDNYIESL